MNILNAATLIFLVVCSYTDFKWRKIPNCLIVLGLVTGVLLQLITAGWNGLQQGVQGFLLGIALLIIPFMFKAIGAGDVKFLAVIGLLQGTRFTIDTFLYGAIAGGFLALAIIQKHGKLKESLYRIGVHLRIAFFYQSFGKLAKPPEGGEYIPAMPYAIAISFGAIIAFYMRWSI